MFKWKFWKRLILSVIVAIVAVVALVLIFLDPIVEWAVSDIGSKILGVPVRLEAFDSSLFSGRFELKNLSVANPEGYQSEDAFKLGRLALEINYSTLLSSEIVIPELTIEGAEVDFELQLNGRTNLTDIKNNIGSGAQEETKAADKPEESESGKKILIQKFSFTGGKMSLASKGLNVGAAIPLPNAEFSNVSSDIGAGKVIEMMFDILVRICMDGATSIGAVLPDIPALSDIESGVGELFKSGTDAVTDSAKSVKEGVEGAAKEVGEEAKKGIKAIKDLF